LLYKPTHVPVGQDQMQHLELTNTIARKFNNKFGQTFTEIKPFMQKPLRIMSLTEPERKMSKSEPGSYINIFDEPDEIKKKLAKAVTATDAPAGQMPKGVFNLFELLTHFGNPALVDKFKKQYHDNTIKYSELKDTLAQVIADYFKPMRKNKDKLMQDDKKIQNVIVNGAKKANKVAEQTLALVKSKIGLI
ncbi:MAG TPA: tryptophan--tRNA ligase, partial [Methylomirabilota bacterium]|nr:tryptophan--tRNA ligase [Methylomirabilota bacterium]